jgi:hypothetical protein
MSLWGDCKYCGKPLSDYDIYYGYDDVCDECSLNESIDKLKKLAEEINEEIKTQ